MKKLIHSRKALISAITVILMVSAGIGIFDVFFEDSNLRILAQDKAYRSGQPFANDWNELYQEAPFKSVLNLRGQNPGRDWYEPEAAFMAQNGINHYNLALSAHKKPDLVMMEKMVAIMKAAPKPLLIHCKQGADRSGLASALYAYAIEGQTAPEASKQLSLWYGHFRWFNTTVAMDNAFDEFVKAHPQPLISLHASNQMITNAN